jgi:hypothetical protein
MSQDKPEQESIIEAILREYAKGDLRRRNAKQMLINQCYMHPQEAERRLLNIDQDG